MTVALAVELARFGGVTERVRGKFRKKKKIDRVMCIVNVFGFMASLFDEE